MRSTALFCGAVLGLAASYAAACENPPLAPVPTAQEVENLSAQIQEVQTSVREYHAAMEEYTACLQAEVDRARADEAPDLVQNLLVQRNNAAVAEVDAVVAQFNQLVRTFDSESGQEGAAETIE